VSETLATGDLLDFVTLAETLVEVADKRIADCSGGHRCRMGPTVAHDQPNKGQYW
jgi:hypothetical protein